MELLFVFGNQRFVKAVESVNVDHHASWAVNHGKVITKEFLSEATDLMQGAFVVQDFFDCIAVAKPVKMSSPKIATILAHGPTAGASFSSK